MGGILYRVGAATARHRVAAIAVWVLLVVLALVSVRALGAKTDNTLTLPGTDSQAAYDLLAGAFPPQQNGTNPFVFHVERGRLTDRDNRHAIEATFRAFEASPHVADVQNPVGENADVAGILSDDERTGIMPVLLDVGTGFITHHLAEEVLAATSPARRAGITVEVGGSIGSVLSAPDTQESELIGNVSAMVILALVFGSLVAMGLPILTAGFGLAITTSVVGLLGHGWSVPSVASTLAVMIGLAVGIDYALFLMTKHIEQLDAGMPVRESIARSVATSGSAVVFAGGTVVIALASLAVAGIPLVTTLGLAAAIAVLMAVLTSITLLPAILSVAGPWVRRVRIPAFLRMRPRPVGERRWDAWARWVTGHPWIAVGASLAVLVPLIVPLFSLELGQPDVGVTPVSTTERRAYDLLTDGFGVGYNGPLLVALRLDPVAEPSTAYTRKYDDATQLQTQLRREQKALDREQRRLETEQVDLEREQRRLERQAAALERQQAALEADAAVLGAQESALERDARALAAEARVVVRRIALLEVHLDVVVARERVVERRLEEATDPATIAHLEGRLERLRSREADLRSGLRTWEAEARGLERQAVTLAERAERIVADARALEVREGRLRREAEALEAQERSLEGQATVLRRQADALHTRADAAERQKRRALKLKRQLTAMLTEAGGDPRGTDPRIVAVQDAVTATSGVVSMFPPQVNDDGGAAIMSAVPDAAPSSDDTATLVTVLRVDTLPPVSDGIVTHVGGATATYVDLAARIARKMPLVVVTVLTLSFVFLMVAFRSVLVPLQAGLTNLLSVAAALGVLTAVFQWGWGLSAIGLEAPGGVPIASYVPLMMFAVLFGISMDYEVFLVSKIQHRHATGDDPTSAVTAGLGEAARVVTAAALIMVLVFASFVLNGDPTIKQFGVGLAVAVALAGTLVVVLAPALLRLFGRGLFALPRFLDRLLPRLDVEGEDVEGETVPRDPPRRGPQRGPGTEPA